MSVRKTYRDREIDPYFKKFAKNEYWQETALIENYIYLYHLNMYIILPSQPEEISDTQAPNWQPSIPLLRTAPVQAYTGNQARNIQATFLWHRDLLNDVNATNYSGVLDEVPEFTSDEDYVDKAVKALQAAQLPVYGAANKQVKPPVVAMRLGEEVFIKGILTQCGIQYKGVILRNNKYATVQVSISITETEAYDAEQILEIGSNRTGSVLERGVYDYIPD